MLSPKKKKVLNGTFRGAPTKIRLCEFSWILRIFVNIPNICEYFEFVHFKNICRFILYIHRELMWISVQILHKIFNLFMFYGYLSARSALELSSFEVTHWLDPINWNDYEILVVQTLSVRRRPGGWTAATAYFITIIIEFHFFKSHSEENIGIKYEASMADLLSSCFGPAKSLKNPEEIRKFQKYWGQKEIPGQVHFICMLVLIKIRTNPDLSGRYSILDCT